MIAAPPPAVHAPSATDVVARAFRLHTEGRAEPAAAAYRAALALDPATMDALHLLGVLARGGGALTDSLRLLARAARLAPDAAPVRYNFDFAARSAIEALEDRLARGRPAQALELAVALTAARPDLEAAEPFLGPTLDRFVVLLHQGLAAAGDPATVALARKALALSPAHAQSLHLLGYLERRGGRPEAAVALLRRALAAEPGLPLGHYSLGVACLAAQDVEGAITALRAQVARAPGSFDSHDLLVDALKSICRFSDAVAAAQAMVAALPDSERGLSQLCQTLMLVNRTPEALPHLRRLLAGKPDSTAGWMLLGMAEERLGNTGAAVRCERRSLRLQPNSPILRNALAELLGAVGEPAEALALAWRQPPANRPEDVYPDEGGLPATAILDRIDAVLPPSVPRENALVYVHDGIETLGHLVFELSYLRSLYAGAYDTLILICRPRTSSARINPETFEIATRGFTVVEIEDRRILNLAYHELGVLRRRGTTYLLHSWRFLSRAMHRFLQDGGRRVPITLSERQRELGRALRRRYGIPEDVPIAALHLRQEARPSFRNVTTANYLEAIRHMAGAGYAVVRLGDRSMPPLPDLGPAVIDTPFHPASDALTVPYMLSACDFLVASVSGPADVARAFGRPLVSVNVPVYDFTVADTLEVMATRRFVAQDGGGVRPLSWREVLSAFPCFGRLIEEQEFVNRGWWAAELEPHEIRAVVAEMMERLQAPDPLRSSPWQDRFRAQCRAEEQRRVADPVARLHRLDWFGYNTPTLFLADAQQAFMPGLLD